MSEENVEIVRRFYEAGQRSIDAYWENPRSGAAALEEGVLAFLHPEVEYHAVPAALEGGTAHGHLGWLRSWDAFLGASEEFSYSVNEVVDLGGGEVFVEGEITAKWKGSRMTLTEPRFTVFTLRDGLIARVNAYRDRQEALQAAGLRD